VPVEQVDNVQAVTPVNVLRLQLQLLDTFQLQMVAHQYLMQFQSQVVAKAAFTTVALVATVDQVAAVLQLVVQVEHQQFQVQTFMEILVVHRMVQAVAVAVVPDKQVQLERLEMAVTE
jgi:hypothetical protein